MSPPAVARAQELKQVFEKLHKFVGKSVEQLVHRPDAPHVFRLHKKVSRAPQWVGGHLLATRW